MPYDYTREEFGEILIKAFSTSGSATPNADWNEREAVACRTFNSLLGRRDSNRVLADDVYLGGDSLRPYLTIRLEDEAWIVSVPGDALSMPRLLREIESGYFGEVRCFPSQHANAGYLVRSLSVSLPLADRLTVPNVFLSSLTNASRYKARRYPLNVARLGQWLRFQHVGRVKVADLSLTFDGDLSALSDDILSSNPDILGLSVNFGELDQLRILLSYLREAGRRPVICLGNALAAWSPEEIKNVCVGFDYFISPSYGETDLEKICSAFDCRLHRIKPSYQGLHAWQIDRGAAVSPAVILIPDEHLLVETLRSGGQVSIETSFGCHYGRCSFCPRDHRGSHWLRPARQDAAAVVDRIATLIATLGGEQSGVLSFVDEEAFGEEGVATRSGQPSIVDLVHIAGSRGVRCEIYARLEQIFDRGRTKSESIGRMQDLLSMKDSLARVFVGVESGSDSQLRRYIKGQTVRNVVDALRVGSLLGLPLEFGFITFDPFLTQYELVENLEFLARTDILLPSGWVQSPEKVFSLMTSDSGIALRQGDPVFTRIAYMATELELFANSTYLRMLSRRRPQLKGDFDSSFSRYNYSYEDVAVARVANWCRVWTEGTFKSVYRLRLASRTFKISPNPYEGIIRRYREATFALMLALTTQFLESLMPRVAALSTAVEAKAPVGLVLGRDEIGLADLTRLWRWVVSEIESCYIPEDPEFSLENLEKRRKT